MSDLLMFQSDSTTPRAERREEFSPDLTVPAMYERLIGALRRAADACSAKEAVTLKSEMEAASTTVFELLGTLNFRDGGELTPRLAALYGYFASEILILGHSADRESLDRLIEMVDVLNGQWTRESRHAVPAH
ncbi:MAG: Flagellar protein FliS [Gemmatimonadetes bacterium]|nr:Flagellar protein FliS [Gemmatimonadota bacterium]